MSRSKIFAGHIVRWLALGAVAALGCQAIQSGFYPAFLPIPTPVSATPAARLESTQPPAHLTTPTASAPERLVYQGTDGNVYLVNGDGSDRQPVTTDGEPGDAGRQYSGPTWAPDGRQLAFARLEHNQRGNVTHAAVLTARPDVSTSPTVVFDSDSQTPIYLAWSPDSHYVAFLASNSGDSLSLYLAASGQPARQLATGSPFYFSWSPDSRQLLVHTGGAGSESSQARLSVLGVDGSSHDLDVRPSSFQAPAWSPTGNQWALAAEDAHGIDSLFVLHGSEKHTLLAASGQMMAFSWSPDGRNLAYVMGNNAPFYGSVHLIDVEHNLDRSITPDGEVVAFFWSPDGQQVAYLTPKIVRNGSEARLLSGSAQGLERVSRPASPPAQQGSEVKILFAWRVVRLDGKPGAVFHSFASTREFELLIQYFDQYAQSYSPWSHDGRSLVYAAESNGRSQIAVVDLARPDEPRIVGDGTFAAWSPK